MNYPNRWIEVALPTDYINAGLKRRGRFSTGIRLLCICGGLRDLRVKKHLTSITRESIIISYIVKEV